jgi:hypothetical protein
MQGSVSPNRPCWRQFPIEPAEPTPHLSRDFVPWRFSDAGGRRMLQPCPCTASEKPAQQATFLLFLMVNCGEHNTCTKLAYVDPVCVSGACPSSSRHAMIIFDFCRLCSVRSLKLCARVTTPAKNLIA